MPNLYVSKEDLKAFVDRASGAVGSTDPALQCFSFNVKKNHITLTASDQANTVVTSMSGEFDEQFNFLAPAAKFLAIVRQAAGGLVQISVERNVLSFVAGSTSWDIKIPFVTYPKVTVAGKPDVELSGSVFRDAIRATRKSMAEDALRPPLRMLSIHKGSMVACDGARLSQASLGAEFPRDFTASIPANSVGLVWDLVKDDSVETVGIAELENHSAFIVGDTQLLAKKLNSSFPNVEKILLRPALENKQEFIVDRVEILKAIDRVRINADTETDAIGLSLSSKSVTVTARDINGNTGSEVIPSSWIGKDRVVIVNHKHLTSLIRGGSSDECCFFLGEDTKSRKSVVLLKDEEKQIYGLIPQFAGSLRVM